MWCTVRTICYAVKPNPFSKNRDFIWLFYNKWKWKTNVLISRIEKAFRNIYAWNSHQLIHSAGHYHEIFLLYALHSFIILENTDNDVRSVQAKSQIYFLFFLLFFRSCTHLLACTNMRPADIMTLTLCTTGLGFWCSSVKARMTISWLCQVTLPLAPMRDSSRMRERQAG